MSESSHPLLDIRHPTSSIRHLYIHTPFCVHKCHYCDFYSFVDTRDQQGAFVDRLIDELRALAPHAGPLRTIFIGGGTPTLLRIDLWQRLLAAINDLFDLSVIRRPWRPEHADPWRPVECGEFTVECNPESTTPDLLAVLRAGGVNRVSIGAQSFNPRHLKTLERWHDPDNVQRAVELARAAGIPRQSIDLIFAIPGQTLDEWNDDLRRAIALNTTHLSCYSLTYEPNTPMTARLNRGQFAPCPEDLEADMFRHTAAALKAADLARYEVSNFASPGHESRHNLAYWVQHQWLAAGPSASGHVFNSSEPQRGDQYVAVGVSPRKEPPESPSPGGATVPNASWRYKNIPRLGDYLASSQGLAPITDLEPPDPLRLIRERIMMGLRLSAGLDIQPILTTLDRFSPRSADRLRRTAAVQSELGTLTLTPERWTLTDKGFLLCDGIAAQLMRCIA